MRWRCRLPERCASFPTSWSEFGGAMFAGAVTGGMAGALVGGGGVLPGMVGGALLGGAAYAAVYAWDGLSTYFFGC